MNTIRKARPSGFSLIELLIGVAILFTLVSLAVPGFRAWLKNAEIRNAAESIQNGLQRARAEAVLRNTDVQFVLTDTDDTCEAANTCSSWVVVQIASAVQIDARSSKEGSAEVKRTTVPANMTTVTFNNLGGRVADAANDFTEVTLDSTVLPSADSHELRIMIGVGGNVRMCDPSFSSGPRKC